MRPFLPLVAVVVGCSSPTAAPARIIVAASPPQDDGRSSEGGGGGNEHAAALEQLKVANLAVRGDKQGSIRIPLPDAAHWMRVKFWNLPTLVGFRYGQGHHAVVGATLTHVADNTVPGACAESFEKWALPLIDAYDIDFHRLPPTATPWRNGRIAEIETLDAKAATIIEQGAQAIAYGVYPAWPGACLIVGVAVPSRDGDRERAAQVRDRFVREVLPAVEVTSVDEPKERY